MVRPVIRLVSALIAVAALGLGMAASPAGAKKKRPANPLAGRWVGMTESTNTYSGAPAPLSYRITNSGRVVGFTTTVTLHYWLNPPPPAPPGPDPAPPPTPSPSGGCPNPIQATVAMPAVKMQKQSDAYPKGKRWSFQGVNPNPAGSLNVTGKTYVPGKSFGPPQGGGSVEYRRMEGGMVLGGAGTVVVAPNVICRTGAVYWSARRVGR